MPAGTSKSDRNEGSSACPVINTGKDGGMQTAGLLQQVRFASFAGVCWPPHTLMVVEAQKRQLLARGA